MLPTIDMSKKSEGECLEWINRQLALRQQVDFIVIAGAGFAMALLTFNTQNRRFRPGAHERYKRTMIRGEWMLGTDVISLASDRILNNGQHRLCAIRDTGCVVHIRLCIGSSPSERMGVDIGDVRDPRTNGEVWGIEDAQRRVPIVRALMFAPSFTNEARLVPSELKEYCDLHQEALDFAMQCVPPGKKGLSSAPVAACCGRAWYSQDRDRLIQFFDKLHTGVLTNQDLIITRLRDTLLTKVPAGSASARRQTYALAQSALKSWLTGRGTLSRLMPSHDDLFPIQMGVDLLTHTV